MATAHTARERSTIACALLVAWLAVIYLPDIGRGFLKDDFRWIAEARITELSAVRRVLTGNVGFYRPLVTVSFAVNHAMFGLWAYGYALTNFLLLALCIAAIHRLGRAIGLERPVATIAAAIWALNFHGVGGSLLWISGRTSLLATLFAVAATTAWIRRRYVPASVWLALALLSKEDAVVVPALMALWSVLNGRLRTDGWRLALVSTPVVTAYLLARHASGAFTYWSAPTYYAMTFDTALLARNVLEYADRNATLSIAVLLAVCVAGRSLPHPTGDARRAAVFGLLLAAIAQLPTLALPARSSLYVLLPSVGITLAGAAAIASVLDRRSASFRRRAAVAAVAVAMALWPVYHLRNQRLKRQAEVSAAAVSELRQLGSRAAGRTIVLRDDPSARDNFAAAFGSALPDVRRLVVPQAAALVLDGGAGAPPLDTAAPRIVIELRSVRDPAP